MFIGNRYEYNNVTGVVVDEDREARRVLLKSSNGVEFFLTVQELKKWNYIGNEEVFSTLPARASQVKNSKKKNKKVDDLLDYLFDVVKNYGAEVYTPKSNVKMRMFKINGHLFMKTSYSKNSVKLYCRSKAVGKAYPPTLINKHTFDYVYTLTSNTPKVHKQISYLVKVSLEYQLYKDKKQ